MELEQIRLDPEAGLAGAGAADNQDIFVSGIGGILGAAAHHQALGSGQDHIVLKDRIDKGGDILCRAP